MASVISNYSVLHELCDWSLDNRTVTEMKARIRGVQVYTLKNRVIYSECATLYKYVLNKK